MALTEEKFHQKQAQLTARTAEALGVTQPEAEALLRTPRQQSVRVNTLLANKADVLENMQRAGVIATQTPWLDEGLGIDTGLDAIRDSTLVDEGKVYIQNAASWLPVIALDAQPGEVVLDMCAAPGGKTSHIAQRASNKAQITANDNSRPRLHKLQRNLERLGVENVIYTLHDATMLSRYLEPESFDKILLDAPCSGEGMMQLDTKKDFESWSVAHVKRLQKLQKKLIVQAWRLLKPGGTLVYSTCTIAPEENEAVVDYLLRHNENATVATLSQLAGALSNCVPTVQQWNEKQYDQRLNGALRLAPSPQVEAFFVVKLKKQ